MRRFKARNFLPKFLCAMLWGNREKWGFLVNPNDQDWLGWQQSYLNFYVESQRTGIGKRVNDAGYNIMMDIDISDKVVLEIGAGDIRHLNYWNGKPSKYLLADISDEMMNFAKCRLSSENIYHETFLLVRNQLLPIADQSVDVVASFYSLEHIYPLEPYLKEIMRVLRPGGMLIGAIPAEGGLAWGLGRFLTTRRWFKKHTTINPDKIICWEHPNFADEILSKLEFSMSPKKIRYWPFSWFPALDLNLIIRFQFYKN